jgi:hypothetical protein
MDTDQYAVLYWLVNELEDFVITSRDVGEDEMSLNYAVGEILRSSSPAVFPPGYDVIRGRAYNTKYCIISYDDNGQVGYRYEPARGGGFIARILDNQGPNWTHTGRSKPDIMAVHRRDNIHFRLELKAPGDQPDVRCWNQPFRGQIIEDIDLHVSNDSNTALLMVMSEMAYRRSRGEPWEDHEAYEKKVRGGVPPVGGSLPFPTVQDLVVSNAAVQNLERPFLWQGRQLRVIYRLYTQTAMLPRQFIQGSVSFQKQGNRYSCIECGNFFRTATQTEEHFRDTHPAARPVMTPQYRVVVAITQ